MKKNYFTLKFYTLFTGIFFAGIFALTAQVKEDFEVRYQDNIKGDITFIGNNIINLKSSNHEPNDPYDGNRSNDDLDMQYIDIDEDASTFSSSSAVLSIPNINCSRVVYAGLYWSAVYKYNEGDRRNSGREADWNRVKLKTPGGNYTDLKADEVLFNGYGDSDFGNYSPYACYKEVTSTIQSLSNPSGEYTIANVRASSGSDLIGGMSGGWSLVVIYEDPTLIGKKITTFDGYAGIKSGESLDIPVKGFRTLPEGFPVNAKMGVMTLEGDRGIDGDQLRIKADSQTGYDNIFNNVNPNKNFFNGSISLESNGDGGVINPNRNPNSENTLGWDVDLIEISNSNNSIIPNDETGVTLRAISTQDKYDIFFTSFDVEIIEPDIKLAKGVLNKAGESIQGEEIQLGQEIQYTLSFDNIGNDDGTGFTIRDVLPRNVDFQNVVMPHGEAGDDPISYSHDPVTNEIIFTIPDEYVIVGRGGENTVTLEEDYTIRINVKVQENCDDLRDACSNIVKNLALASYRGVLNDNKITDDRSVLGLTTCLFDIPGSTNFLPDLSLCGSFERTIEMCGESVVLTAGNGYDRYQWYKLDGSGNYTIIPDATNQTYTAVNPGTYKVEKQTYAKDCKDFEEIIHVNVRGTDITNPIASYADQLVTCTNDGTILPKFFLCGTNDDRLLTVSFPDAPSLVWEKLDEKCEHTSIVDDCPTKDSSCDWDEVGTGNQYLLSGPGEYRLVVTFENGCFNRFYFKADENSVSPVVAHKDMACGKPGYIEVVSGVGSGYEYAIEPGEEDRQADELTWQSESFFEINIPGTYGVYIRQKDVDTEEGDRAPCLFRGEDVVIEDLVFGFTAIPTAPLCYDGKGSIAVSINGALPHYSFWLKDATGSTIIEEELGSQDNYYEFSNQSPGEYIIEVQTEDGCRDQKTVIIPNADQIDFTATAHDIACDDGSVVLNVVEGTGSYDYAIWSYTPAVGATKPTIQYKDISEIPATEYFDEKTFSVSEGAQGTYVFLVTDRNGCNAISNEVTVNYNPPIEWDLDGTDLSCFQSNDGVITVNHGDTNGYTLSYQLIDLHGNPIDSEDGVFNNLPAGRDYKVIVTQTYGDQRCTTDDSITLIEPDRLTASAGVSKLPGCNESDLELAEVRITNPLGGTGPYEYNFNDGAGYGSSPIGYLKADTHTVYIKDDMGCTYAMEVEIPELPVVPTAEVSYTYNCDGTGNVTVVPSIPDYDYTYDLNGSPISGDFKDGFSFEDLTSGTHTVTVHYNNPNYATYSNLLKEDFGSGANTTSPYIDPVYCYESQYENDPSDCEPEGEPNIEINDGEYSVTSKIDPGKELFVGWISPNDHTDLSDPEGRYMAINIGGVAGINGVIFKKRVFDVIPHQKISVELEAFNLIGEGTVDRADPYLVIQLVGTDGVVINEITTDRIPRHSDANSWFNYAVELNPEDNEELDIVIRTQSDEESGNDIAIDDILAYQIPQKCDFTLEVPVELESKPFSVEKENPIAASCNDTSDGVLVFSAENFSPTEGFEYSLDNTNWTTATTTPVEITGQAAGDYTVYVRDKRNPDACKDELNIILPGPDPVTVSANATANLTCANAGATIMAEIAKGGTPPYTYQLEDEVGNVITPFDFIQNGDNREFNGVAAGKYVVVAKDSNDCAVGKSTVVTVDPYSELDFTLHAVDCYDGENGEIRVSVNSGNNDYQFAITPEGTVWDPDTATWFDPEIEGGTTYIFKNRTPGNYTIHVRDGYECVVEKSIAIFSQLTASITSLTNVSCKEEVDGEATIIVSNAQGDYSYTVDDVLEGSGISQNTFTLSNLGPGDHRIIITDEKMCSVPVVVTVNEPTETLKIVNKEVNDITCNADGNVIITAKDGWGGYKYKLTYPNGFDSGFQDSNEFTGLTDTSADYTITIKDAGGCEVSDTFGLKEIASPEVTLTGITGLCYDSNTGGVNLTATVTSETGTPNYSYVLNNTTTGFNSPSQTSNVFENLTPGTYTVTVTDANGCTDTSEAVTIEPELVVSSVVSAGLDCSDNPDGEFTVNISGGFVDYSYEVSIDGATYGESTNLTPGVTSFTYSYSNPVAEIAYKFRITDSEGCVAETGTTTIQPITLPEAKPIITDVSCSGNTDGIVGIDIDETKGLSPYTVSFDGSSFTPKHTYSNLSSGSYNFVIRDSNGCEFLGSAIVGTPDPIDATITINPMQCKPKNDTSEAVNAGSFEVNISQGGVAPFTYELFDSSGNPTSFDDSNGNSYETPNTSHTFVGINIYADYIIKVTDANGCEFTENPVRMPSTPFLSLSSETVAVTCTSGASISIIASEGNGDYTFEIFGLGTVPDSVVDGPELNQQTATFSGLNPGQTYIFEVTDIVSNCVAYHQATTTAISSLAFEVFEFEDVSCNGSMDGTLSYEISGIDPAATHLTYAVLDKVTSIPTPGFNGTIALDPSQTNVSGVISDIPPGTYVVAFKEEGGTQCSLNEEFFISEPSEVKIESVSNINANCTIGSQITVRGFGGIGPYTYAFVQNGSSPTLGDYSPSPSAELDAAINNQWDVYVMDSKGCTNMIDLSITTDPAPIISGEIEDLCAEEGKYAAIIKLEQAGIAPYTMSVNGQAFQSVQFNASNELTVSNLHSGNPQKIQIRDKNGCIADYNFDIFPPLVTSLVITAQPVCSPNSNPFGSDGEIAIKASGGSGNYTYELFADDGTGNAGTNISGDVAIDGTNGIISEVNSGMYIVRISDAMGDNDASTNCIKDLPVRLVVPTPVAFTVSPVEVGCKGGSDGSISVELDSANDDNPPYNYELVQIDGPEGTPLPGGIMIRQLGNQTNFRNLPAGWYNVAVTSNKGCVLIKEVQIKEPPLLEISAKVSNSCGNEGTHAVTVTLDPTNMGNIGTAPYKLEVNGVLHDNVFDGNNDYEITDLNSGDYSIKIIDANGCVDVITTNITIIPLNFKPDVTTLLDCETSHPTAGNAIITLSDFNGSGDYSYQVTGPNGITGSGTVNLPTVVWDGASQPGNYVFTVTDDVVGCSVLKTVNIPEIQLPTFTAKSIDALCYNTNTGKIQVSSTQNGLTYAISPSPAGMTFTNNTFNNLPKGTYIISGTGANSCETSEPIVVGEANEIIGFSATVTPFECASFNNGGNAVVQATVPTGGSGVYRYEFVYDNGTPGEPSDDITQNSTQTEFIVSNPVGGTVTATVIDSNGCRGNSDVVVVEPFVELQELQTTVIQPTCNGADGSILVEVSLVDAAIGVDNDKLKYYISNVDGSYTDSVTLDYTDPSPLDHLFENLSVGSYSITVTNEVTNCEIKTTALLTDPNTFDVEVTKIQDAICYGGETGIVDVNLIDDTYTGGFEWTIYNALDNTEIKSGNATDNSGIHLYAGAYYVEMTQIDRPFCVDESYFNITQPENPLEIDAKVSKSISCTDPGEITVSASGGYGSYEFKLVDQASGTVIQDWNAQGVFTSLGGGTYQVYVRDYKGCDEVFETLTLRQPTPITAQAIQGEVIYCDGDMTASIEVVNVSGGRPAIDPSVGYLFVLNRLDSGGNIISSTSAQSNDVFTGLQAGNYSVKVFDNYGCDVVTNMVIIEEPDQVVASLSLAKGHTCSTGASLRLTADGGSGTGYQYSDSPSGPWIPFGGGTTVDIDIPGVITAEAVHSYYVRDSEECISQVSNSVTLSPIRPLEILPTVVSDVSCYGDTTGYINVEVKGGLGNYKYSLIDGLTNVTIIERQSDNTFSGLSSGVYYVQVASEDCSDQVRIAIEQGNKLTAKEPVIVNPICTDELGRIEVALEGGTGEYQYAISPNLDQFQPKNVFEDLEPGTYTIIAQDSKGCNPFVFKEQIIAPAPLAAKANILQEEYCIGDGTGSFELIIEGGTPPYSTAVNTQDDDAFEQGRRVFQGLKGGETYVVFVRDANGCQQHLQVAMKEPVNLAPKAELRFRCLNNTATNEVEIVLAEEGLEDVIYSLDGGADQFRNKFSNVAPGEHTVTVSYFGCERKVDFNVAEVQPLRMSVNESNLNEFTMYPSGGTPPYEYFVDGNSQGSESSYVIRVSGVYQVKVVDASGCEQIAQIDMEFEDIKIPNVFTPDGDGNNDYWPPSNYSVHYPNIITKIYDRYGRVVAELRQGDTWNGRYNGTELPTGDYWYVMKLNGVKDDREFVGHFTLYR